MADWPREIKPEDRIKYLVNARAYMQTRRGDGHLEEKDEVVRGFRGERLIGEFDTPEEAAKAILDDIVVELAIRQAWEDLAT